VQVRHIKRQPKTDQLSARWFPVVVATGLVFNRREHAVTVEMIGLDSNSVGGHRRNTKSEMRWHRSFVAVAQRTLPRSAKALCHVTKSLCLRAIIRAESPAAQKWAIQEMTLK
jgi:hypothetical protein